jgi:tetratricopeptide (TPR) repeat protein
MALEQDTHSSAPSQDPHPHREEPPTKRSLTKGRFWIFSLVVAGLGALVLIKHHRSAPLQTAPSPPSVALEQSPQSPEESSSLVSASARPGFLEDKHSLDSALKSRPIQVETPALELPPSVRRDTIDRILLMQAKFATGDFDGALAIAEKLWNESRAEGDPKVAAYVEAQLPAILVSSAWSQIRFGRYELAIERLLESRKFKSLNEATKGLALSFYKLHRVQEALDEAENYLQSDPTDEVILLIVSDLYESQNRFQESLEVLQRAEQKIKGQLAQAYQPTQDQKELVENLRVIQTQKKKIGERLQISKSQRQEQNGIFKLSYSEIEHDSLAGWVLDALQESLDELTQFYSFKMPSQAIEVILYEQKEFHRALGDAPHWVDGLFDGRIRVPIKTSQGEDSQKSQLRTILNHELVHALFANASGQRALPPWFDEGMAQRFSCFPPGCRPFIFQANPGVFLQTDEFQKSFLKTDTLKAQRLYQQSLYLILTAESIGGPDTLRTIIENIKSTGDLSSDTLVKPLGLSFAALRDKAAERWKNRDGLAFSSDP